MAAALSIWPDSAAARDRLVRERRGPRPVHDPWRHQGVIVEDERTETGAIAPVATVFLTGHECPWRCVMCDLWQHTTTTSTPAGAIPAQVGAAISALRTTRPDVRRLKLYNAGSFLDQAAVPAGDYAGVTAQLSGIERIVIESHPALVAPRLAPLLAALTRAAGPDGGTPTHGPQLEVAVGLETAHPEALRLLHKGMDLTLFLSAATHLRERGVGLRVFLLVQPPFIPAADQHQWLQRSVDVAVEAGATAISLIPVRPDAGALAMLANAGLFTAPSLADLEESLDLAIGRSAGQARVFADLWDLDRLSTCPECREARRHRLHTINLTQSSQPPVKCTCEAPARSPGRAS